MAIMWKVFNSLFELELVDKIEDVDQNATF